MSFGFGGFGAKPAAPAFGSSPGGGLFGSSTTTPAFGQPQQQPTAFGQPQQQQSAFGSTPTFGGGGGGGTTFGSSFGASTATPAFGAQPAATSAFGQPAASTGGFGASSGAFSFGAKPAFGASNSTFGGSSGGLFGGAKKAFEEPPPDSLQTIPVPTNGSSVPFTPTLRKDPPGNSGVTDPSKDNVHTWQSISSQKEYWNISPEELRYQDYQQNRKTPTAAPPTSTPGGFTFGAQQQQQPAAGGFGASTSTPAFGQQTSSPFGGTSQPATGLFGAAKPASPFGASAAPAFGAQTTAAPFSFGQQSAQPTNVFGSSTPAFGQQPAQPATGLFGSTSQPAQSGGLFGQPAQPATSTPAFGGFGATSSAPKPGGFTFGAQPTSQPAANTFGQAPASTGFSFGTPAASTQQPTGGLFGNTQPQTSTPFGQPAAPASQPAPFGSTGSIFGSGGASKPLFGSAPTSTPAFGAPAPAASSPFSFGAKPATPAPSGGLFGGGSFGQSQPAQQPATMGSGFNFGGNNSTAGTGTGLFGSTLGQSQQPLGQSMPPPPPSGDSPYGSNPLFASAPVPKAPFAQPADMAGKIKPALQLPMRRDSPARNGAKITHLRFAPGSSMNVSTLGRSASPSSLFGGGRQSPAFKGVGDSVALSPNAFVSRPSVKKLVIDRKVHPSELRERSATPGSTNKVSFNPELETATPSRRNGGAFAFPTPNKAAPPTSSRTSPATPAPKSDYICEPSIEQLGNYPPDELSAVENFTITRPGHGSLRFLKPVDLTTVKSLRAIAGGLIVIDRQRLNFYDGEDDEIPPPGEGLNVEAIATLEGVWPTDKSTGKPAKTDDANSIDKFRAKLKKRTAKMPGGAFVEYAADSGTWTFKVDHF